MFSILLGDSLVIGDSEAKATVLKNGVRVGDRSAMNLSRPPRKGARKRIFAPSDPNRSRPSAGAQSPRKAQHDWFWAAHNPKGAADAARWERALATLASRHAAGQRIWPEERLQKISEKWRLQIGRAAQAHDVSEILLLAVVVTESLGNEKARSPKGAQGLMQLIPATAARFGVGDAFDPVQNINGGAAYLAFLLAKFKDDPILALAGYNAGENAVVRHGGVPPYVETRDYVAKVFDAIEGSKKLCGAELTGPRQICRWREAARDGV